MQPVYRVTLMTPEQWQRYAAFAHLPPAGQAFELMKNRKPLSVTKELGDRAQTIDSSRFKGCSNDLRPI